MKKKMPRAAVLLILLGMGLAGYAQELTSVPTFRRQARFTAYSEGWGLYSEWLAREMPGTYQDPYSQIGRLGSEHIVEIVDVGEDDGQPFLVLEYLDGESLAAKLATGQLASPSSTWRAALGK